VAIRTTFIVGSLEKQTSIRDLLRFVQEAQFDRVGAFEYSVEDGTPSADLPNRVPARINDSVGIDSCAYSKVFHWPAIRPGVGREMEVLVESDGELASGRSFRDGPK